MSERNHSVETEQLSPAQERSSQPLYRVAAAMQKFNMDIATEIEDPRFQLLRRAGDGGFRYTFFSRRSFDKDLTVARIVANSMSNNATPLFDVTPLHWEEFVHFLEGNDKLIRGVWQWLRDKAPKIEQAIQLSDSGLLFKGPPEWLIHFHDRLLQLYPAFRIKGYMPLVVDELRKRKGSTTDLGYFVRLLEARSQDTNFQQMEVSSVRVANSAPILEVMETNRDQKRNETADFGRKHFDITDFFMGFVAPIFDANLDWADYKAPFKDMTLYKKAPDHWLFIPLFEEWCGVAQGRFLGWLIESYFDCPTAATLLDRVKSCHRYSRSLAEIVTTSEQLEVLRQYQGDISCKEFVQHQFKNDHRGWSIIEPIIRCASLGEIPDNARPQFDNRGYFCDRSGNNLWVNLDRSLSLGSISADFIAPEQVGEEQIVLKFKFPDDYVHPTSDDAAYQGIANALYRLYRRLLEIRFHTLALQAQQRQKTEGQMLRGVSHSLNTDLKGALGNLDEIIHVLRTLPDAFAAARAAAVRFVEGAKAYIEDIYENGEVLVGIEKYRAGAAPLPERTFQFPKDIISDLEILRTNPGLLRLSGEHATVIKTFLENGSASDWVTCPEPFTLHSHTILKVALQDIMKNALRHIRPSNGQSPIRIVLRRTEGQVIVAISNNVGADEATRTSVNSVNWQLGDGHFGIQLYKMILDTLGGSYEMVVRDGLTTVTVMLQERGGKP